MKDNCLICLSDCDQNIRLSSCSCKMILHENCFIQYTKEIKEIKCVICHKIYTYNTCVDNIFNSFLYTFFLFLQNFYFYLDQKFLSETHLVIRTIFVVIYHCILLLISIIPYLFYSYYIYFFRLLQIKPYKVYNL